MALYRPPRLGAQAAPCQNLIRIRLLQSTSLSNWATRTKAASQQKLTKHQEVSRRYLLVYHKFSRQKYGQSLKTPHTSQSNTEYQARRSPQHAMVKRK